MDKVNTSFYAAKAIMWAQVLQITMGSLERETNFRMVDQAALRKKKAFEPTLEGWAYEGKYVCGQSWGVFGKVKEKETGHVLYAQPGKAGREGFGKRGGHVSWTPREDEPSEEG